MAKSVIKNDKSPIKSMTFTTTTTRYGNFSFINCGLNTDFNLVVGVSAYITAEPTMALTCIPYRYTAQDRPSKINGAHVAKDDLTQPIINTEISGTIYYISLL